MDKVVTVRSPLHGGSRGDKLDFLIGNDDGTFRQISSMVIQLHSEQDFPNSSMYILEDETNGFRDILIIYPYGESALLRYESGRYLPIENSGDVR